MVIDKRINKNYPYRILIDVGYNLECRMLQRIRWATSSKECHLPIVYFTDKESIIAAISRGDCYSSAHKDHKNDISHWSLKTCYKYSKIKV